MQSVLVGLFFISHPPKRKLVRGGKKASNIFFATRDSVTRFCQTDPKQDFCCFCCKHEDSLIEGKVSRNALPFS